MRTINKNLFFFLLALFIPASAFAQVSAWIPELEYSPRPAPVVGQPGCWFYEVFMKEVPNPDDTNFTTLQIDHTKSFFDLYEACPPAEDGTAQTECPVNFLDIYLPEVPRAEEMSQYKNMTVVNGVARCNPGFVCGGIEVNVAGQDKPALGYGCVPLAPQGCESPKVMKDGVCQHEQCPGGCGDGQKCSVRVMEALVDGVPMADAMYFCEAKENLDPPGGGLVQPGEPVVIYPPNKPPVFMPPAPCPADCPTAAKGCIPVSNMVAKGTSPAAAFGQERYCDGNKVAPKPGQCLRQGLVLPGNRCFPNKIWDQPPVLPDKPRCPDPCQGKKPCVMPMVTKGPESFQKPTDENGCPCPPPVFRKKNVQPSGCNVPDTGFSATFTRRKGRGKDGGGGSWMGVTGKVAVGCQPAVTAIQLPGNPNSSCGNNYTPIKKVPYGNDGLVPAYVGMYNSGKVPPRTPIDGEPPNPPNNPGGFNPPIAPEPLALPDIPDFPPTATPEPRRTEPPSDGGCAEGF